WRRATLYTISYATIGLFWYALYGAVAISSAGLVPEATAAAGRVSNFGTPILSRFHSVDFATIVLMTRNGMRFMAWQNPLSFVLLAAALVSARAWSAPLVKLAVGVGLTVLVAALVMPFQGHGWGYR